MTRRLLIVCAAPEPGSRTHLARLARSVDAVLAVDGGLDACRAAGVTPAAVVGDLDSVSAEDLAWARDAGVDVETYPADKDVTDLDLALRHAVSEGATEVVVTACTGARVDHALGVFGSLARSPLPVIVSEPRLNGWLLAEGVRDRVVLKGTGATVSVLPLTGTSVVSCSGVRWPLSRARLEPLGTHGISNVIVEEAASFEVHEGVVAVLSPRVGDTEPATESV